MRKLSRKGFIKKLDAIVTKILLKREPCCVICGSREKLGTSHIFSRKNYSTRWDTSPAGNNHINCWPCNYRHSMVSTYAYNTWYIHQFGQELFDQLYQRWIDVKPVKTWELEEKLEELKLLVDKPCTSTKVKI